MRLRNSRALVPLNHAPTRRSARRGCPLGPRRSLLLACCVAAFAARPAAALETADYLNIAWDAVVLRPIGFVQTVFGAVLFIPVFLLGAGTGNADEFADTLIFEPYRLTFERPLGEL